MNTSVVRCAGWIALGGWLLLVDNQAVADDLFPPPWRGLPRTTLAEWDFATAANPTPPDGTLPTVVGDSGGVPMAEMESDLEWDPVFNGSWHPRAEPPPLINTLIFLEIPNWIDQEPLKLVQVQLTYQPGVASPHVVDVGGITGGTGVGHVSDRRSATEMEIDPIDGIWHRTELWRIRPNPDEEVITIDVPKDSFVTQIVVDTISTVPEPTSAALALLGVLAAGRFVRRW